MIIENNKKGWYGSFSDTGRRAARSYFLITKNDLSSEAEKKYLNKDSLLMSSFETTENKNKIYYRKSGEEAFDIFDVDETDKLKIDEITKTPSIMQSPHLLQTLNKYRKFHNKKPPSSFLK